MPLLIDEQFRRISCFLPGRLDTVGVTAKNNRQFLEGVFYIILRQNAVGVLCLKSLVLGKGATNDIIVGERRGYLRQYFRCFLPMPILSTLC